MYFEQFKNAAVFLDRDGTLIEDVPYNGDPIKVKLLPGVGEGLLVLQQAGFKLIVVSNQSGVGLGKITEADVEAVQRVIVLELQDHHYVELTDIYNCYHASGGIEDFARKPGPGMLLRAAWDHDINLRKSFIIGDRETDTQAGLNAGIPMYHCFLLDPYEKTFAAAVDTICRMFKFAQATFK